MQTGWAVIHNKEPPNASRKVNGRGGRQLSRGKGCKKGPFFRSKKPFKQEREKAQVFEREPYHIKGGGGLAPPLPHWGESEVVC